MSNAATYAPTKIWSTLLTNRGYLAGVLVLDYTLKKHHSQYQLVLVIAGPVVEDQGFRDVLRAAKIPVKIVEPIEPANRHGKVAKGPWEKLAAFNFTEYDRIVMLDCDQIVTQNLDELMTMDLPAGTIAASHACTCNPAKVPHYPKDWIPENCGLSSADLITGQPETPHAMSPKYHRLLNGGLIVMQPSEDQYVTLIDAMNNHPAVPNMVFAEQDLYALVYENWFRLPYIYNAMKTLRGCHSDLWKDSKVKIIHYILQKPWKSRKVDQDIVGSLHQHWWDAYKELESSWYGSGNATQVRLWKEVVEPQVAPAEIQYEKKIEIGKLWENVAWTRELAKNQFSSAIRLPESLGLPETILYAVLAAVLGAVFLGFLGGGLFKTKRTVPGKKKKKST